MKKLSILLALALALALAAVAAASGATATPIAIVAAENFYGDVVRQIGGGDVQVTSILNNPDEDPHLFEASPSVARAVSAARIVVYSGIDYDPWMKKLLAAVPRAARRTIIVAELIGKKAGDNPHIWYDLATMRAFAANLTSDLAGIDPAHKADYQRNLVGFLRSLEPVEVKIRRLRSRLAGAQVTATEPVFGYMLDALGMQSRNQKFQLAVMNNTEPSASEIAAFETDLKTHKVRLLIYNSQATDPVAERMLKLAHQSRIPVVGVTETEPNGETYQSWMMNAVDAVARALPK